MKLLEEALRETVKEFYRTEFEISKLREDLELARSQWKTHQARAERAECEILRLREKYEGGHQ